MNNIKQAFKLLQETGNFHPSQLHLGSDKLWITPYGHILDYKQIQLAMAAAELFHLCPVLYSDTEECKFKLLNY